jgi:hypothetical protein
MEYVPYVGEWITKPWKDEELQAAFTSELKWEHMQINISFKPFEPKVPSTLAESVVAGYRLDQMPTQNDLTWLTLIDWSAFNELGNGLLQGFRILVLVSAGVLVLALVLLLLLFWWIFY